MSVMGADGRELLHQLFGPGACLGTTSLVDGDPRPQTAEAFEAVELQVIERATLDQLRAAFLDIDKALLNLLSRHMRLLNDYFASASLDSVLVRLAQRLVDIADTFGLPCQSGTALPAKLTQSELALMVGAARQTTNRSMGTFQKQGLIATRHGAIVITDLSGLRAVADQGWRLRGFSAR